MTGITGGEGCFARSCDASDLDVADLDRPADLPLPGSDCSRGFCRSAVERQHAAAEDVVDGTIEALPSLLRSRFGLTKVNGPPHAIVVRPTAAGLCAVAGRFAPETEVARWCSS